MVPGSSVSGSCADARLFNIAFPGAIITTTTLAIALSSYLISTLLASSVYQAHTPPGSTYCIGRDCFFHSFVACAALGATALALSGWLLHASRARYRLLFPPHTTA